MLIYSLYLPLIFHAILSYALSSFAIILVWNIGIVAYFKYIYDLNLTVIIIELFLILL